MKQIDYVNPLTSDEAVAALGADWNQAQVMAGGIDLIGELKDNIINPARIVNLKNISGLGQIRYSSTEGLYIGATATLTDIERHRDVRQFYPAIAEGAAAVGTPQIRNVGTLGGNLCQRPRCWYYRDPDVPCWRKEGNICFAVKGVNTYHAILGGGPCYIVAPSDVAPGIIAHGGTIHITGPDGDRAVVADRFFQLPPQNRHRENVLKPNEIMTGVSVPVPAPDTKSRFFKHEERGAWDFAIASVAVVLEMNGDTCAKASVVLGGAAPRPWLSREAAQELTGKKITGDVAMAAGKAAMSRARAMSGNAYKIPLFTQLIGQTVLDALET